MFEPVSTSPEPHRRQQNNEVYIPELGKTLVVEHSPSAFHRHLLQKVRALHHPDSPQSQEFVEKKIAGAEILYGDPWPLLLHHRLKSDPNRLFFDLIHRLVSGKAQFAGLANRSDCSMLLNVEGIVDLVRKSHWQYPLPPELMQRFIVDQLDETFRHEEDHLVRGVFFTPSPPQPQETPQTWNFLTRIRKYAAQEIIQPLIRDKARLGTVVVAETVLVTTSLATLKLLPQELNYQAAGIQALSELASYLGLSPLQQTLEISSHNVNLLSQFLGEHLVPVGLAAGVLTLAGGMFMRGSQRFSDYLNSPTEVLANQAQKWPPASETTPIFKNSPAFLDTFSINFA